MTDNKGPRMWRGREWHGPCPGCRKLTLLPTCLDKPSDVRCCWCGHEFTVAQFYTSVKAGGWWTAEEAAKR